MRWLFWFPVLFLIVGCAVPPASEKDVFDGDPIQLTSGFERAGEAYFSPDMNWIIFQAVPTGEKHYQMYIARLLHQGDRVSGIGHPIRISPPDSRNTCGDFSPDGLSVIFASTAGKEDQSEPPGGYQRGSKEYRWPFPNGMEVFRADAWQGAIAATEFSRGINLAQHPITNNNAYDAENAFSRDGKWIVFTSTRDGDPTRTEKSSRDADLYVMRPDGTGVRRLTKTDGYDGGAFFSPDGSKLVYRSDRKLDNLLQLYVADVVYDSTGQITGLAKETQLTFDPAVHFGPFWHPYGSHIIYASNLEVKTEAGTERLHHEYELFMMRSDGTRKLRLTFTRGADVLPAFSPDGKYLMWSSARGGSTQVWIGKFKFPKAG